MGFSVVHFLGDEIALKLLMKSQSGKSLQPAEKTMLFVLSKEEAITWWYSAYCIYQVSGAAAQQ